MSERLNKIAETILLTIMGIGMNQESINLNTDDGETESNFQDDDTRTRRLDMQRRQLPHTKTAKGHIDRRSMRRTHPSGKK